MRTDTHAIKRSTQETARSVLTARGVNEKEAEAHAEATAEATVEAIVMSQQDLVTKQDLELTTEKLRTEIAKGNIRTTVYTVTILGLFISLVTYFNQPGYVPLPLPGNQVQESQQVEQPEPRVLKPEQPESKQNQQEGS